VRANYASLNYTFRQRFDVPAKQAFDWCTDFQSTDGKFFGNQTRRSVRWLDKDTAILTDTSYPDGRRRRIRRLVRIDPESLSWTNTHLDGPFRHSQYWYRIVPAGARRSALEFSGFRLIRATRSLSPAKIARLANAERTEDSTMWRNRIAPGLERDLQGPSSRRH